MNLRDRVADAIARAHTQTTATVHPLMEDYRPAADAVMEVVNNLAADLDHAERHNRRLQAELDKLRRR